MRDLIVFIRDGSLDALSPFVGEALDAGGGFDPWGEPVEPGGDVEFVPAAYGQRGHRAGLLWLDLIEAGVSPHDVAVIAPMNVGDDGTARLSLDIRLALGFGGAPPDGVGDEDCEERRRERSAAGDEDDDGDGGGGGVAIFNGERAEVIRAEGDVIDVLFPGSRATPERRLRFLANRDHPPEGTAFGYAMTAHKAQGSQFRFVILITASPNRFVSSSSVYTAASRAREKLFIVGDEGEFVESALKDRPQRRTLLSENSGGR